MMGLLVLCRIAVGGIVSHFFYGSTYWCCLVWLTSFATFFSALLSVSLWVLVAAGHQWFLLFASLFRYCHRVRSCSFSVIAVFPEFAAIGDLCITVLCYL